MKLNDEIKIYETELNRYCSQKRAVRAITNSDYGAHSVLLFSN